MIKKRILVVDDDLNSNCAMVAHIQDENTDVCCMTSASEALDSIMKDNYCLLLLSNQLSGINSIEMLRIIRLTQQIPIIVFTTPLSPDDKIALFRAGADAIIDKPLNIGLCAAQAEALIQLYSNSDADHDHGLVDQILFGTNLIIIPPFRQVFVAGKPVSLTRKEFDLLLYFARHPRRVFSREQLYSHVWADSFASSGDETVKAHIQTLRKKLETQGKNPDSQHMGRGLQICTPQ